MMSIKCWESINISDEEYKQFEQIIITPEGRKSWIYYLNERRIKSQFKMPPNGFTMITKLMHEFLNYISKGNDECSAKMAIILSQTFYYERLNEKIYLHTTLINHEIWSRENIWINMIEDGIQKEMNNYAQFCMDESSEEHKEKMFAIIISQLSSYIHIMKTFQISINLIEQVIHNIKDKYKLPETVTSDLLV